LDKESSDWATETKATMKELSPTSLKITLQQLRIGAKRSIADCFKMEYKLAEKIVVSVVVYATFALWFLHLHS
jgi:3-hydroxyisobutyryl-CoA hydrolase